MNKKRKDKQWRPLDCRGKKWQDFCEWLNTWGDEELHEQTTKDGKITDFGKGYKRAINDVFKKLGIDWK